MKINKTYQYNNATYELTINTLKTKDFSRLAPMIQVFESGDATMEQQIDSMLMGIEILQERIESITENGNPVGVDIFDEAYNVDLASVVLTDLFEASTLKQGQVKK